MSEIYKAMSAIMADMDAIGKDQRNQQQGFNYRGIDQVYNVLHPLLAKHKVFTTPEVLEKQRDERVNAKGTVLAFVTLRIRYTFWCHDGSSVSCVVEGEGMDSGDKASNKAMAVAHKYALLQTFCIPTEDMVDPDAESHELNAAAEQARKEEAAKALHDQTASEYQASIEAIKAGIRDKDQDEAALARAAEEWFTLPEDVKMILWRAPSKGGKFTTIEREVMKSTAFKVAYYGEQK